ncbi:tyrosine-type recombinase/integrase [Gammaproteobacteria bacterium]|nr:tyrosine-type recombinase/integrase [Gammaproteobacteria bacterium]
MPKLNLTQSFVNKAKVEEGITSVDYYDERIPGLLMKVLPSGRKTYYIRYKDQRKVSAQRKIGNAVILTLSDARALARHKLAEIAMGADPFTPVQSNLSPTLEKFAASDYIPYVKTYKKSWEMDISRIRNHLLPYFGAMRMSDIEKRDVVQLINDQLPSYKPGSINRVIILLRYMFNLAIKWEVEGVSRNPTAGIPLLKEDNHVERFLSSEEAKALLIAIKNSKNPMLQHIISMLILTGARKREVLDAKWEDFDMERSIWRIPTTKAGKARIVPLSDTASVLLIKLRQRKRCAHAFANPATLKPYSSVYYSWHTARKEAGLSDVRVHDLRHSFASFLVNAGRSLYEVQTLLGHTQIKTTQRYAHLSTTSLRSASNEISLAVPELI